MKSFETQKDRKLILLLPRKSVRSVSNYGVLLYLFYPSTLFGKYNLSLQS